MHDNAFYCCSAKITSCAYLSRASGLMIGFLGGVLYSWVSYIEKIAKDAAKALAAAAGGGAKSIVGAGGAAAASIPATVAGSNAEAGGDAPLSDADTFERDESRGLLRGPAATGTSSGAATHGAGELRAR